MPKTDYKRLLLNTSIEDVARRLGMQLTKTSTTQSKALCPFHDDKTPSLLIDSNRENGHQHFYCFACGAHGDAIDLIKEQLQLGFKEAVAWLEPGVSSAPGGMPRSPKAKNRKDPVPSNNGLKLGYQLYINGSNGEELAAWAQGRKLDEAVLRRAGFAYAGKNFLSRKLDAESDESTWREEAGLLEDATLVKELYPGLSNELHLPLNLLGQEKKRYGDFFIDERIVFPLYTEQNELAGLGGRAIKEPRGSSVPKYQFTKGFPKGRILYRADFAFGLIRKAAAEGTKELSLYLCEGFLDALRFESVGLPAVAVMGAAISEHQIRLLHALSDSLPNDVELRVVVAFDRDEAGLRGAADASLKLIAAPVECRFLWPTDSQLSKWGRSPTAWKDPNDYLEGLSTGDVATLIGDATYSPELALLANEFSVSADDVLNSDVWGEATRSRKDRTFMRALVKLKKVMRDGVETYLSRALNNDAQENRISPLVEWVTFLSQLKQDSGRLVSEEFLNDSRARLNHARILAYMGSRRGELPCNEPRWERLDIAATAFNALLVERLGSLQASGPIAPYDAVWVPRAFGGSEFRLKMMPLPEDLTIQQYLLNEILSERWDHMTYTGAPFSRTIPAVRYYREDRRTVTTGFDSKGNGTWEALHSRPLSFAYQIDMDVLEGRQPASDQGMYRPFHECWRDFMQSVSNQAADIGFVHSIRLDVKRYYDRVRRYVVRDSLQRKLQAAVESVSGNTPGFSELLSFIGDSPDAESKAAAVLDHLDEHLFGVSYLRPDNGLPQETGSGMGIPQGPVLSAWIGSIALFPIDEEAYRLMERLNTDRVRVGYARYVDDIVILADDPVILEEMRGSFDRLAKKMELTLLAKADEIPAMSAEDFTAYINQGRALAASGPAWEPPLVGDGESGWGFWSVSAETDRQSALQLLHNVELYKASQSVLLQTVRTAFQASDLRTSELPKAARLVWYSVAVEHFGSQSTPEPLRVWRQYLGAWSECLKGAAWRLQPEKNHWESPVLFALEGLEHLIDKEARDIPELSSAENVLRRGRIAWLASWVLAADIESYISDSFPGPERQVRERLSLVRWKAKGVTGEKKPVVKHHHLEQAEPTKVWQPFEWMHNAVTLLSEAEASDLDPLVIFVEPALDQTRRNTMVGPAADIFRALLPDQDTTADSIETRSMPDPSKDALSVALQTIISIVPKEHLAANLNRRQKLIWRGRTGDDLSRLTLPPLPGIATSRIFSLLGPATAADGVAVAHAFEAIDCDSNSDENYRPIFIGSDAQSVRIISPAWTSSAIDAGEKLLRLEAKLPSNEYLRLRQRIQTIGRDLTSNDLKIAAKLFRSIYHVVSNYSDHDADRELVPAWPYIATTENEDLYFVIGDGVSRSELGTRAFVKDGGRALRTIEVPAYEANLWRVGVAISDYLGFSDDVIKFSDVNGDVTLDAHALASPARYLLRAQLRKLRGAYADSQISKRRDERSEMPSTVERSLHLLESFPDESGDLLPQILHVLAAEAESAAMFFSFRDRWQSKDISSFLMNLTERAVARLPLSVAQSLARKAENCDVHRRDFVGLLCFARTLFDAPSDTGAAELPVWKALRAGVVTSAVSVAMRGLIASLRSHGEFERYTTFDFPADWGIPCATFFLDPNEGASRGEDGGRLRTPLTEQLREIVQRLGHRLRDAAVVDEGTHWATTSGDREGHKHVSVELFDKLRSVASGIAKIETQSVEDGTALEWPFDIVSGECLDSLNLELLESVAHLITLLDRELNFEAVLVVRKAFGYNAQTRRFTDSRDGIRDVTPWMITQFPRNAKRIEEISDDGSFLRVWSEVFDRSNGKLLSVSALGEPFASISLTKAHQEADSCGHSDIVEVQAPRAKLEPARLDNDEVNDGLEALRLKSSNDADAPHIEKQYERSRGDENGANFTKRVIESSPQETLRSAGSPEQRRKREISEFRRLQVSQWALRGAARRPGGHIRIALLQANFDITYKHPLVETCPINWPFCVNVQEAVSRHLMSSASSRAKYEALLSAGGKSGSPYLWTGHEGEIANLGSWSEHRRQAILRRVIDSCDEFGVDLLVLPEYSVRRETIEWLKIYLSNKNVSVLAGTFMEVRKTTGANHLAAPLTLLWPLPQEVKNQYISSLKKANLGTEKDYDALNRGHVIEFSRDKKYRSIALEEFFRPSNSSLSALFRPDVLAKALENKIGFEPSADVMSLLLAGVRLPLKYLFELICSEIFLVSSPANYRHMLEDLDSMLRRFGEKAEDDTVFTDIKTLSDHLSITGDGKGVRRSVLAVPAATSRSADYWIAGQAGFLAAGTATVFCNSIDGDKIVGGSCFIGCGSWKSEDRGFGYIPRITPYHGWSKGIFYNNGKDALSSRDQAVVIADIDPHNMLEGKPRAQTMPSPLQLVAYLPLVETVDWTKTEASLLRTLSIPSGAIDVVRGKNKARPHDEKLFWDDFDAVRKSQNRESLTAFWQRFPDPEVLAGRAKAFIDNGDMQPVGPNSDGNILWTPAFYDWIDVSLTLAEQQELPIVEVPPWKIRAQ